MKVKCKVCGLDTSLKFIGREGNDMVYRTRCSVCGATSEEKKVVEKKSKATPVSYDYAVVKKSSGRARRVFDERPVAELCLKKLGSGYEIEERPRA